MRILLIGKAGAGKDTVADYLVSGYGFHRYAFADKLKEIARELFPEAFRDAKPRTLLQNLGSYIRREDPDAWVKYLLRRVEVEGHPHVVITDCRYCNELELSTKKGFVPVLVYCPAELRSERLAARGDAPLTPDQAEHPSENDVFGLLERWPRKSILDNSGDLVHLYRQVDKLVQALEPELAAQPARLIQPPRPSWQETFMEVASIVARRSTCLRRKVGAVLVKDNRIIATGYNGAPKGMIHCTPETCLRGGCASGAELLNCRAVHAEENCIIQAAIFGVGTTGAELYVTCHPCTHCAKTLINAGVKHIYYLDGYPDALAATLLEEAGVGVTRL